MPWAEHLGSQVLTEQTSPCQPASQTHRPDSQDPWGPQSKLHRSVNKQIFFLISKSRHTNKTWLLRSRKNENSVDFLKWCKLASFVGKLELVSCVCRTKVSMLCCDREKKLEQRGEKKVSRQKTTTIFSLKVCFIWGQKRPKKANTYAISILESGNSLPLEQSFPVHWPRQTHFWVSRSKSPWPEQSGRHCLASLSTMAQVGPLQPWRHTHEPSTQNPWPVHVGSGQSSENRIELNSRKILLAKKSCFFHTKFPTKKLWNHLLPN